MNHTHTKGPWAALIDSGITNKLGQDHKKAFARERYLVATGNREGSEIIADCGMGMFNRGGHETIANARLVAAAPDMLNALESAPIIQLGESLKEFFIRYCLWLETSRNPSVKAAIKGKQP